MGCGNTNVNEKIIIKNSLQSRNVLLVSGDCDSQLLLVNIKDESRELLSDSHFEPILCIKKITTRLISTGSKDKTIKLWDLNSKKCIITLIGHSKAVKCIEKINNKLLVSGSLDFTIKIWDLTYYMCLITLKNHNDEVNFLLSINENVLISCGADHKVNTYSISELRFDKIDEDIKFISSSKEHCDSVILLTKISSNEFISSSMDCTLRVWEVSSSEGNIMLIVKQIIKLTNEYYTSIFYDENIMIATTSENYIVSLNSNCLIFEGIVEIKDKIISMKNTPILISKINLIDECNENNHDKFKEKFSNNHTINVAIGHFLDDITCFSINSEGKMNEIIVMTNLFNNSHKSKITGILQI